MNLTYIHLPDPLNKQAENPAFGVPICQCFSYNISAVPHSIPANKVARNLTTERLVLLHNSKMGAQFTKIYLFAGFQAGYCRL